MKDLSILIPARNEIFLNKTIEDVLSHIEGDTEIIAVLDGAWPEKPIQDHPRVQLIYHHEPVGQRAATNEAASLSKAKYIMKLDAHCSVDQGFDVKLMADCEHDWTIVPRMYNLHAFDWVCPDGHRRYQSPSGDCKECGKPTTREVVWQPRWSRKSDFMRFDNELKFQYWGEFGKRPEAQGDLAPTMSLIGACWFMHRDRYWELDGLDEDHGSWGQMGTEIACKSWLSGGQLLVNKKTWFAHMFRTQGGDFSFPYELKGSDVDKARKHSRDVWLNNKWPKAKYDLKWLINKFSPVPTWDKPAVLPKPKKSAIFYTDNRLEESFAKRFREQILVGMKEKHIVSSSLKPMDFGRKNVVIKQEPSPLTMFMQILAALEESDGDVVFFLEHDVLYHPKHFDFIPPKKDVFYYNTNVWKVRDDGLAVRVDDCRQTSGLVAYKDLLIEHYKTRILMVQNYGFTRKMGYEPGTHNREERVDDYSSETYSAQYPNLDIRHGNNLTQSRWSRDEFRNAKYTEGWQESRIEDIKGWEGFNWWL